MVGIAELKVAAWYIMVSRDEAHCMFPPSCSTVSSIWSADLVFVDLKANLSII